MSVLDTKVFKALRTVKTEQSKLNLHKSDDDEISNVQLGTRT